MKKPVHKNEKGQSLLEFALFVVILFILLAGVVDLGTASFHYMAMRDAAQEGINYGSVYPDACDEIRARVRTSLVDPASVTIDVEVGGVACESADELQACMGNDIVITVTNPHFALTMPLIGTFLGTQSLSLSAEMTGSVLRPSCEVSSP